MTLWAEQNQTADDHAKRAAKGSLRESGKRILCLSDRDLLQMADLKAGNGSPAEYLGQMLDDLLIHLEKWEGSGSWSGPAASEERLYDTVFPAGACRGEPVQQSLT